MRSHRRSVSRVKVHDAAGVLARLVDGRMDGEAAGLMLIRSRVSFAVEVDLDQARRRDLLEHHPVGIDQEVMVRARHARRNVGVDEVVPAVQGDEAIAGGEIDALVPLGVRHAGRDLLQASFGWRHGSFSPTCWFRKRTVFRRWTGSKA